MRKLIGGFAAALLLVLPALAADSGPVVNESIPMLHVDAFNDGDAGKYCITCKAGQKPTVVAFVAADTEANRALIAKVNEQLEAHQDAKLAGAVVILGDGEAAQARRAMSRRGLQDPTSVVAPAPRNWPSGSSTVTSPTRSCSPRRHGQVGPDQHRCRRDRQQVAASAGRSPATTSPEPPTRRESAARPFG